MCGLQLTTAKLGICNLGTACGTWKSHAGIGIERVHNFAGDVHPGGILAEHLHSHV